jgi:hypothetical protein
MLLINGLLWIGISVSAICGGCGARPGILPIDGDGGFDGGLDSGADGARHDGHIDAFVPADAQPPLCDEAPLAQVIREEELCASAPRVAGDAYYDPQHDRVLVIGGLRGSGDYSPDVVAIDVQSETARLLSWLGNAPQGWTQAGSAHDPTGHRVFVVGGMVYGNFSARVLELRFGADVGQDQVQSLRLPDLPVRARGAAVGYDRYHRRLVVFGGYDGTGDAQHHDTTWTLDPDDPFSAWQALQDSGGPPAQENSRMIYVPTYGLVLLAATAWSSGEMTLFTMRQGSERWTEIGLLPTWNTGNRPSLFWDASACRLIYWGGGCTAGAHTIALFENTGATSPLSVPFTGVSPRVFMNATLDPLRDRIIVHGGYDCQVREFLDTTEAFYFNR